MTTQFKAPICCGKQLTVVKDQKTGTFSFICPTCGRNGHGKTPFDAGTAFEKSGNAKGAGANGPAQGANLPAIPENPGQITSWIMSRANYYLQRSSPVLDKRATLRMFEKNAKYVEKNSALEAVWLSDEGIRSILDALEESYVHGCTLPEMGSIVPYGGTVAEFDPSIEGYLFVLTVGRRPPLRNIRITSVYSNDIYDPPKNDNGVFSFSVKQMGFPRGEMIGVVVQAFDIINNCEIGQSYDLSQLIEKAKRHSKPYINYLRKIEKVNYLRAEGKILSEYGREYYDDLIEYRDKKTGQQKSFTKKIYLDELTNPYEGPDREKMYEKMAGKSFLKRYYRIRNGLEMAGEWEGGEPTNDDINTVIDQAITRGKESVRPGPPLTPDAGPATQEADILDAEYEDIEEPPSEPARQGSREGQQPEPAKAENKPKAAMADGGRI